MTEIGDYAFAWCGSLTSMAIPASVTRIGDFAFPGSKTLTTITVQAGSYAEEWAKQEKLLGIDYSIQIKD